MFAERIERKLFQDIAPQLIQFVTPVSQDNAEGVVAEVYRQAARDFLVAPPLTLHSPVPNILAGVWGILRESMLAGPVNRTDFEVVAAAVSKINECPYCVDVHTMMLHGGAEHALADRLLNGNMDILPSSRMGSIVEWALAGRSPDAEIVKSPPFSEAEAPNIIGTAVAFHFLNRMVNIFLDESPLPVPSFLKWLKAPLGRLGASLFGKRLLGLSVEPGDALSLLPDMPLPDEFSWARSNPMVAAAFARFAAVIEEAGQSVVPVRVRELVQEQVDSWQGEDPGMSRQWVEDAVADLSDEEKASGRLALLVALAPYQVDDGLIEQFRRYFPSDEALISTTAWASYVAARQVARWLQGSGSSTMARMASATVAL